MADAYLGEIRLFAGNFAPRGWALCQGQLMPLQRYTALYAILGTQYGGDGRNTFALPNLQARVPIGQGAGGGLTPRSVGNAGGSSSVTLITTQMPMHNHVPQASKEADESTPKDGTWAPVVDPDTEDPIPTFAPTPNVYMSPVALSTAGSDSPHNNVQPYLGLNYIICLEGIFPPKG